MVASCSKNSSNKSEIATKATENKHALSSINTSECDKLEGPFAPMHCYGDLGAKYKEPSICEQIGGGRDVCYNDVARELKDEKLCEKIIQKDQKDECYKEVGPEKKDAEICNKISDNSKKGINDIRGQCLSGVVRYMIKEDKPKPKEAYLVICDTIQSEENKEECYKEVATNFSDPEICSKLKIPWEYNDCYWVVAEQNVANVIKDNKSKPKEDYLAICDNFQGEAYKGECYHWVAVNFSDMKICGGIANLLAHDNCYWDIARQKEDASICNNLKNNSWSKECLDELAYLNK